MIQKKLIYVVLLFQTFQSDLCHKNLNAVYTIKNLPIVLSVPFFRFIKIVKYFYLHVHKVVFKAGIFD